MTSPSPVVLQIQTSESSSSPFQSGNSAQYLYGFTITFIALFIAFAACAYSSRRGRRRIMAMEQIPWNAHAPIIPAATTDIVEQAPPKYEEVWLDEKTACAWQDVKPLSGAVVRDALSKSAAGKSEAPQLDTNVTNTHDHADPPPPHSPSRSEAHGYRMPYMPPQLTAVLQQRSRRPKSPKAPQAPNEEEAPPTGMQVSMLISMPCPVPLQKRRDHDHGPGDVILGVTSVPWEGGSET
ncbi:hypothetical protein OE88DRAFT_1646607 [Heliocybe sulcata]|uniref:Uncharacterized protein n=1 Tax=Heliocybe sulcata TaxID=5364 RepID=A0A5C3MVM3_9AGAM|nr:hypothetical protein OE88DRAFT_1646607 [Heliocybe sulcata]